MQPAFVRVRVHSAYHHTRDCYIPSTHVVTLHLTTARCVIACSSINLEPHLSSSSHHCHYHPRPRRSTGLLKGLLLLLLLHPHTHPLTLACIQAAPPRSSPIMYMQTIPAPISHILTLSFPFPFPSLLHPSSLHPSIPCSCRATLRLVNLVFKINANFVLPTIQLTPLRVARVFQDYIATLHPLMPGDVLDGEFVVDPRTGDLVLLGAIGDARI
jgi:hypothetical protein